MNAKEILDAHKALRVAADRVIKVDKKELKWEMPIAKNIPPAPPRNLRVEPGEIINPYAARAYVGHFREEDMKPNTVLKFFNIIRQAGDVGVEIEVEGRNLYKDMLQDWRVEHDGSLRGQDNAEYVLRKPLPPKELREAIKDLKKTFDKAGSKVDLSRRTSTHVHINCTNLKMIELMNYVTLLLIFEEFLVDWCGGDRNGNLFCLQSKDAEGLIEVLRIFVQEPNKQHFQDNIRYSAINLAALNKYGSLEMRSLRGTIDEDEIMLWVDTLLHLRERAAMYSNPIEIVQSTSLDGIEKFVKDNLGTKAKVFYKGRNKARKLMEAIRRVQDVAFAGDWNREVWQK